MRTILTTLAAVLLLAFGATAAATAAPSATTKLSPAETKYATPAVKLWNALNAGLLVVVTQATAKDALFIGTKNNGKLTATLAVFITCNSALKKAGTPPPRLTTFSASLKRACTDLEAGAHDFAKSIGAIHKGNSTLGQKKLIQGIGELKQGSAKLAVARKQLLALGGKTALG
jgi:hypothetical protein